MSNKVTAVEWLFNNYVDKGVSTIEAIDKALEIEKEQIIDAWKMGRYDSDKIVMTETFYAEQYYKETYLQ